MQPLRLFWWSGGNFGDELSRLIVAHVSGRRIEHAPAVQADLISIGSLLERHFADEFQWNSYRGVLWGCGRMYPNPPLPLSQANVRAVRGRLTLEAVTCRNADQVVLGDPALLASELVERQEPEFPLGVIPHLSQRRHPLFQTPPLDQKGVRLIDVTQPPETVLAEIARCRHILSSSLHGLVVADALGIPNGWLWTPGKRDHQIGLTEFKFRDYYTAFDEEIPSPLTLHGGESLETILANMRLRNPERVKAICSELRKAFPKELQVTTAENTLGVTDETKPQIVLGGTNRSTSTHNPDLNRLTPFASGPSVKSGVETIRKRWPNLPEDTETAPVFVLSAGWRSGSTFLQRMLMQECFVWGEPYGHACPIPAMAETLRCFTNHWPEPPFFSKDMAPDRLESRFIANLYPSVAALKVAHEAWFRELFERPAKEAGAKRWGLKEVRLTIDHAHYLKWLFPAAKFVFLFRNPYDAWRSFAARRDAGARWYRRWPDQPVNAERFGQHWRESVSGFLDGYQAVDGFLVRYEDLAAGKIAELETYLGFPLSRRALKLNPSDGWSHRKGRIKPEDLDVLDSALGDLPDKLHYQCENRPSPKRLGTASPSRCVILVLANGPIAKDCDRSLRELESRGYSVWRVGGYAAADQGRCQMATDALRQGFEELMWIDRELVFDPGAVERLRAHRKPVVGGLYPEPDRREFACDFLEETTAVGFGTQGGLLEIASTGIGFLHTRKEVYEAMIQQLDLPVCNRRFGEEMFPFFLPQIETSESGSRYLNGERAFCAKIRACGFAIIADTTIRLSRLNAHSFGWEDAGTSVERFQNYTFYLRNGNSK